MRDLTPSSAEPDDAVWRISVRPSAGPAVLRTLSDTIGAQGYLDWGGGLVWIAGTGHRCGARSGRGGRNGGRRHLAADARARRRCAPRWT